MILVLAATLSTRQKTALRSRLLEQGITTHLVEDARRSMLVIPEGAQPLSPEEIRSWKGVERVVSGDQPFLLASRDYREENTEIRIPGVRRRDRPVVIGGSEVMVIAGPCAVEFEETTLQIAHLVKQAGCRLFRGGAFKPRSSPYSFQGLGHQGLRILEKVRKQTGLLIVTEVLEIMDVDAVAAVADVIQVGTRNMTNFNLLKRLGEVRKPVLLKRGMSSTIREFLMAAEYILVNGNPNVILCERGIRTFETFTRFNLDINAVPAIKQLSHLPIIVDPSHATGIGSLVEPVALAGIAAGADGLLIEVHPSPDDALSDGQQAIKPHCLPPLLEKAGRIAEVLGRSLG